MNNKIGIIGGDLRIMRLAEILAKDGLFAYIYGLGKINLVSNHIIECKSVDEVCANCDYIISGIPFSKNEEEVDAPFNDKKIRIKEVFSKINNKTLVAGAVGENLRKMAIANNVKIVDLMDDESFTVLNVIPTVEGALQVAMQNTEFTIHDSECLVLGFGRIGKILCSKLQSLGANVSCMARKDKDLAWIKALGYKGIHINELSSKLNKCNIIFNTVPAVIIGDKELEILKRENKKAIIVELASSPGGVNPEKAKEYGIDVISAQGLPGKVAPLSAAKYIKQTIDKILN